MKKGPSSPRVNPAERESIVDGIDQALAQQAWDVLKSSRVAADHTRQGIARAFYCIKNGDAAAGDDEGFLKKPHYGISTYPSLADVGSIEATMGFTLIRGKEGQFKVREDAIKKDVPQTASVINGLLRELINSIVVPPARR